MKLQFGYNSYGTIYGTVRSYDTEGVDLGPRNITSDGLFFVVRENFDRASGQAIFRKSIGTGITLTTPVSGLFSITVQSADNRFVPGEYAYNLYISNDVTFNEASTQLKSIGSGIYEILEGPGYGTAS